MYVSGLGFIYLFIYLSLPISFILLQSPLLSPYSSNRKLLQVPRAAFPSSPLKVTFIQPLMEQFTEKLHFETLSINNRMCKLSGTQKVKHYGRLKLVSLF